MRSPVVVIRGAKLSRWALGMIGAAAVVGAVLFMGTGDVDRAFLTDDADAQVAGELLQRGNASTATPIPLKIVGDVGNLYPGAVRPLYLRLVNSNPWNVAVDALDVVVSDASPSCPAALLTVGPIPADVIVPAKSRVTTSVKVRLARSASNACIASTFPLGYRATVRQVP